jgi:hypothetical protein
VQERKPARIAMSAPRTVDATIELLSGFLKESSPAPATQEIAKYLQHRNCAVTAAAAACAARHGLRALEEALLRAYDRFAENGVKVDRGCLAKKAIAKALQRLELGTESWFATAAECVQLEPTFGGMVDTAIDLRCECCRALSRFPWYNVAAALVHKTGDTAPKVRMCAINTIAAFAGREPLMVLLTKAQAGDPSPEVIGTCLRGLIELERPTGLAAAARRLEDASEDVRLEAAFAIGESRCDEGFKLLHDIWQGARLSQRSLVLAISTLRTEQAAQFLRDLLSDRQLGPVASEALQSYPEHLRQ